MEIITRKSIRIRSDTEALLKRLKPEFEQYGAGYIVDCLAADLSGLPHPLTPDERVQAGYTGRGEQLKGQPALNPAGSAGKRRKKKNAD